VKHSVKPLPVLLTGRFACTSIKLPFGHRPRKKSDTVDERSENGHESKNFPLFALLAASPDSPDKRDFFSKQPIGYVALYEAASDVT
jgi:hypothetical protein